MKRDINLRHLAHLVAVCDSNFSVSRAANRLQVTQSVVSRNIQALEEAMNGQLFDRHGRRLVGMTPLCEALIERVRDITARLEELHHAADAAQDLPAQGELRVACTHLQARYILPQVLKELRAKFENVTVSIQQCFPVEINDLLMSHRADIGICSEPLADAPVLRVIEAYSWERALIMPRGHELAACSLTLARLATEPTITYVHGITGRRAFDKVFAGAGLHPNVIVAAADSDVIKQFTRQGLGVGVISCMAYEPQQDMDLVARRMPKLFGVMHSSVLQRRDCRGSDAKQLFVETFCRESARIAAERREMLDKVA